MFLTLMDSNLLKPSYLLEGYSSLIWTERWLGAGEFELKTSRIKELMPFLTEGNILGIKPSPELMIIENRNIQDSGKGPELVVTGRSLFAFMENRTPHDNQQVTMDNVGHQVTPYPAQNEWNTRQRIAAFFVSKGLGSTNEITNANPTAFPPAQYQPAQPADTLTQGSYVTTGEYDGGYDFQFDLSEPYDYLQYSAFGNYYDHIMDLLKYKNRGIVFDSSGGFLYIIVKAPGDRTVGQPYNTPVVIDKKAGHLQDVSYFWSNKDYKNIAYVTSPYGFQIVAAPGVSSSISGMNRRVLQVDAGDLDITADHSAVLPADAMTARGLDALMAQTKTVIIDAKMSPTAPFRFGYETNQAAGTFDYSMGDLVTLKADYGITQTMQITEYIRSEDSEGNIAAYPTLTAIV